MKMKINIICFVLLLFLLAGVVSAANNDNETLEITNEPGHLNVVEVSMNDSETALSKSVEIENKVESTEKNVSTLTLNKFLPANKKVNVKIVAPNVKMHYKDGSKFKITLKDSFNFLLKNQKVKIQIGGQTYTKITDNKGTASLNLNLKSGTYRVLTIFDGSNLYYKQNVSSTVTIQSTIKCGNFAKYYKNDLAYSSTFYDSKGKVLKNTAIKFKLNSKTFSVKTNVNGVAKLSIDLKPGSYSISVINSKTSESISKTVTIKNLIITKDVTMTAKDGSKYSVKLLKSNGKAAPYTSFKLNLNGKVYFEKTDKNGVANIKLNLNAGKYSVSVQYQGLTNINKIIVNKITSALNYLNPLKKASATTSVKKVSLTNCISVQNDFSNANPYVLNNLKLASSNQNGKVTLIS